MALSSFARRPRPDRERVDPLAHQVAERLVHFALPLEAVHAGEYLGLYLDGEMAFAAAVMPGMAAMAVAVVDYSKFVRSERLAKAFLDFRGDGSGESCAHWPYIEGLISNGS
jgi:hypothetical protein